SAQFSPSTNASGGFVGFLGNDANGFESDVPVADTVVANVYLCGDGVVDPGEQCDDANSVNGDACDNNCTFPACGNGIVDPSEECDDGNVQDVDCCSSSCTSAPDATPCDDHLFCNGADTCASGACTVHGGDPCTGGTECNDVCNEVQDTCFANL